MQDPANIRVIIAFTSHALFRVLTYTNLAKFGAQLKHVITSTALA